MKTKLKILGIFCFCIFLFTQCKDDDTQVFRAYVEGKIQFKDVQFLQQPIHLISENKIIAETYSTDKGNFVLAGPYYKGEYELRLKKFKIKSFSTQSSGCKISSDSLGITIPAGMTYVYFDNIELK